MPGRKDCIIHIQLLINLFFLIMKQNYAKNSFFYFSSITFIYEKLKIFEKENVIKIKYNSIKFNT